MLMLILISFVITGMTAFYNFKSENERYNQERLERKERALQKTMSYFLDENNGTIAEDSLAIQFSDVLVEMADVHSLSINMYDLNGNILISSSEDRFDDLGFDLTMDYSVLKQLSTGNDRPVTQKTHKDKDYILVFWYLTDYLDKKIAIVNVKYDKKNIDGGELKRFLVQLTQIYILLFIGASLLAYFLSNYITKSLQKIASKMKRIDLSGDEQHIQWEGKDEIGALVRQYNRMLDEVKLSAERLAKSERESAWREMAKQVAHEIKNPLTPMKLRVQHLQRTLENDPDLSKEQVDKFAKSMIDQIDTLSGIATEFSHFAKMPNAKNETVNLGDVIEGVVDLYTKTPNCTISLSSLVQGGALVFADKDQLNRVLTNLIKNAIQATEEVNDAWVHVSLRQEENNYLIEVKDNGIGILESQKDKIFVPNFTTKSKGAGLGLAMVKNIVNQTDGEIWFESTEGQGTSFFVQIPAHISTRG